jgi:hypothetical protein
MAGSTPARSRMTAPAFLVRSRLQGRQGVADPRAGARQVGRIELPAADVAAKRHHGTVRGELLHQLLLVLRSRSGHEAAVTTHSPERYVTRLEDIHERAATRPEDGDDRS